MRRCRKARWFEKEPIDPKQTDRRNHIPVGVGFLVLFACVYFCRFSMRIGVILAVLAYFLLRRVVILPRSDSKAEVSPGISRNTPNEATEKVRNTAREFDQLANEIEKREIVQVVRDIAKNLREIAYDFEDDPSDVEMSRIFVEKRLGEAVEIVSAYARLSRQNLDERGRAQLAETEEAIRRIKRGFHEHLQRCLSNDLTKLRINQKMTEYFYPDRETETPPIKRDEES